MKETSKSEDLELWGIPEHVQEEVWSSKLECVELWEETLAFKREAGETPMKYLEKWLELEAKIWNSYLQMFLGDHFLEGVDIKDNTRQSILTLVTVEEKRIILAQVKKAFNTLVTNLDWKYKH